MSDQNKDFDQVFRDRLSDQTATSPPAAWENIQAKRNFGHVVANRISNNWGIFGTLLMLLLAGGSSIVLFGEEETNQYTSRANEINKLIIVETIKTKQLNDINNSKTKNTIAQFTLTKTDDEPVSNTLESLESLYDYRNIYPSIDELASLERAGFTRPDLPDSRLSVYIENLD
ncbi:hypothetical protein N8371_05950 [Vicingaceae bacterium]|nr:hypothetical protein [Vicingaceae bacterium]MDB4061325.1 hypothetical protein [Vicingaceae bacterium]MDC1451934.1 hypothetical protein [Vicingaceae bacterium]